VVGFKSDGDLLQIKFPEVSYYAVKVSFGSKHKTIVNVDAKINMMLKLSN